MSKICALAVTYLALAPAALFAQSFTYAEGGVKDTATGLVWSQSLTHSEMTSSYWDYTGASGQAANYFITTSDGTVYDDWRLPTAAELRNLVVNNPDLVVEVDKYSDGTSWLGVGFATYWPELTQESHYYWTSDSSGKYRVYVTIDYQLFANEEGAYGGFTVHDGGAQTSNKFFYIEAFLVRGGNTSGGTGGGKPRK